MSVLDPRFYTLKGPLTLAALIEGLDVHLDPHFYDETIITPNLLDGSQAGDLVFFENKRLKSDLASSQATACLVTERLAPLVSEKRMIPIISRSPRAHFARLCQKLVDMRVAKAPSEISDKANISNSAILGEGVKIEDGVEIGPYGVIGDGVTIKRNTVIGSHVNLSFCQLGENCLIKPLAVIGGAGFGIAGDEKGLIDIPHLGRVILGDRVSIGSQTCIDRGQLGDTILSHDVKVDNLVQIAHNVKIGARSMLAGHVGVSGSCMIGEDVQMGGNVGLADHVTIGNNVRIAARSGVMHDIPEGEAWSGFPAMPIREHMRVVSATRKLAQRPKRDARKDD
jgi:UDP-3-O-[3-hydroxymyristoyl] glucosamine N-acyltransferase